MKTLFLLRHAKSDWNTDAARDHDRPLNPRGERTAATVGRFVAAIGQVPDAIVSSTAVRARSTAELAITAGGWSRSPLLTDELYSTSAVATLELIRRQDDRNASLLLVGHEPTWSDLAGRLLGQASLRVVTAALVRIDFAVEHWRDVAFGRGTLRFMVPPKLLEQADLA